MNAVSPRLLPRQLPHDNRAIQPAASLIIALLACLIFLIAAPKEVHGQSGLSSDLTHRLLSALDIVPSSLPDSLSFAPDFSGIRQSVSSMNEFRLKYTGGDVSGDWLFGGNRINADCYTGAIQFITRLESNQVTRYAETEIELKFDTTNALVRQAAQQRLDTSLSDYCEAQRVDISRRLSAAEASWKGVVATYQTRQNVIEFDVSTSMQAQDGSGDRSTLKYKLAFYFKVDDNILELVDPPKSNLRFWSEEWSKRNYQNVILVEYPPYDIYSELDTEEKWELRLRKAATAQMRPGEPNRNTNVQATRYKK